MSTFERYLNPKNILKFSILNYIQSLLSFGVSMLLAREMSKAGYGAYAYGLIFYNTASVINQFGQDKTLVRDLVQKDNPDTTFAAATYIKIIGSIFLFLTILVWLFLADKGPDTTVAVVACTITGLLWGAGPMAWFDFKGRMSQHALQAAVEKFIYICFAAAIVLFWNDEHTVAKIVTALLVSRIIMSVVEWRYVARTIKRPFGDLRPVVREIIRDNVWVFLAAIGNLLMTQANQLVLEGMAGRESLAAYSLGFQLIMLVRLFQRQIQRLASPAISAITNRKGGNKQLANLTTTKMLRYCGLTFVLTLVAVIPLYLLAPWFITNVVGENYADTIPTLNILLIWVSLYGVALINNQFLLGLHLQRQFFWTTCIFGVMAVVLTYLLVPTYKSQGAALSLLIAHFSSIAVQFWLVSNALRKGVKLDSAAIGE